MNRRGFLTAVASVATVASAGCRSSQTDRTGTDPSATAAVGSNVTVSVVRPPAGGPTETRLTVGADGTLTYRLICDGETTERTARLSPDDHQSFVDRVLAADTGSWNDTYACRGDCPMDVPGRRYVVTVGEESTTAFVESGAEGVPSDLEGIADRLASVRDEVATPGCDDVRDGGRAIRSE